MGNLELIDRSVVVTPYILKYKNDIITIPDIANNKFPIIFKIVAIIKQKTDLEGKEIRYDFNVGDYVIFDKHLLVDEKRQVDYEGRKCFRCVIIDMPESYDRSNAYMLFNINDIAAKIILSNDEEKRLEAVKK